MGHGSPVRGEVTVRSARPEDPHAERKAAGSPFPISPRHRRGLPTLRPHPGSREGSQRGPAGPGWPGRSPPPPQRFPIPVRGCGGGRPCPEGEERPPRLASPRPALPCPPTAPRCLQPPPRLTRPPAAQPGPARAARRPRPSRVSSSPLV